MEIMLIKALEGDEERKLDSLNSLTRHWEAALHGIPELEALLISSFLLVRAKSELKHS